MRLWVFSDLHLEFSKLERPPTIPEADVAVVAGDVNDRGIVPSIKWLAPIAERMPVVFVAGNHEFYRSFWRDALETGKAEAADHPNLHFLENSEVEIGNAIFIGATLWTDFNLYKTPNISAEQALRSMADYRAIRHEKAPFQKFHPFYTIRSFGRSHAYILERLLAHADKGKKRVVVTHHAPSGRSIPAEYQGDYLSPAFASGLDAEIEVFKPDLWIHGHVHDGCDYSLGNTRVLCNPCGYPGERQERPFRWDLVVEI